MRQSICFLNKLVLIDSFERNRDKLFKYHMISIKIVCNKKKSIFASQITKGKNHRCFQEMPKLRSSESISRD